MKPILLALLFISGFTITLSAQREQTEVITVKLQNSSFLPKKVTIITYQPGNDGNETLQVTMMPKAKKKLTYREGTKVYLADSRQVGVVMSGKRIDDDKPFLVIKKEDAGKTFPF